MKNIFTLASKLFVISLIAYSSLSGQERNLDSFTKLRTLGSIEVTLQKGNQHRAEIEMIRGDFEDLLTEVKNDILLIKFKDNLFSNWNNNSKAKITLYYKSLQSVEVAAGSRLVSKDELKSPKMSVDVSSGGSCSLVLNSNDSNINITSGGSCTLSGSSINSTVQVNSGASFNGSEFKSDMVKVNVTSGGSARVWVTDKIIGTANSGGSIRYKGEPKEKILDAGKYSGGSIKNM